MIDSLYIGATGMQAQQVFVDSIANNLANVNTTGFKKNRVSFEDAFYQAASPNSPAIGHDNQAFNPITLGLGALVSSNSKSFAQGDLKTTGLPLDVAITGNGFFEVLLSDDSVAYTRYGSLKVSPEGKLSTVNGQDLKQQINIPTDISAITIDPQGKVTGRTNSSSDPIDLGQIELSTFQNPEGLTPIGNNLYVSSAQTGTPVNGHPGDDGFGTLTQGSLEASNVSLSEELVNLVVAQRAYEMSAKVIQTSDEMLSISNNLRR